MFEAMLTEEQRALRDEVRDFGGHGSETDGTPRVNTLVDIPCQPFPMHCGQTWTRHTWQHTWST